MYTLAEADLPRRAGGACSARTGVATFADICVRARVRVRDNKRTHARAGESLALCVCARGHDNSAEKPRNICPAAINSETARTFLANLHKTVTYHSIIRPIRPVLDPTPFLLRASPLRSLPPFARFLVVLLFSPPTPPPGGSDRVLSAGDFFSRARAPPLRFPRFLYKSARCHRHASGERKRTLCDRVTRYGAANSAPRLFPAKL